MVTNYFNMLNKFWRLFRINCNNCSCLELIMHDVMHHVCLGIRIRLESIWRRSVSICAGLILAYIWRRTLYLSPPSLTSVRVRFTLTASADYWPVYTPSNTGNPLPRSRCTVAVFKRYPTRQALILQKPVCVCVPFFSSRHQLEWRNCSIFEPHDGDTEPIQRSCSPG